MTRDAALILAGTPIGNVGDASPNLVAALESADVIAAEDTRRLRRLLSDLGLQVSAQIVAHHDHNEQESATGLVRLIDEGKRVVVVSDAGMPTVSDPGFRVMRAAIDAGIEPECLPGPSAVTVALALSGLPTDRFCFEGFVPRKDGARTTFFESLIHEPRTAVFFDSPRRLSDTLRVAAEVVGENRAASVSRELTKTYEETRRGLLGELAAWAADTEILGEITVCIGPAPQRQAGEVDLVTQTLELADSGLRLKEAAKQVASKAGVSARELFTECLAARDNQQTQHHHQA